MSDEERQPSGGTGAPDSSAAPGRAEGPRELTRKDMFLGLIHSFQAAAMQQMGKMPSPFTNQVERDLPQARLSIDMLEMLEERTSGNLTGEEARFLKHVLTELRLNYVAEIEEDRKTAASPGAPPA